MRYACATALLLLVAGCAARGVPSGEPGAVERWVPEIVGRLSHDTDAWTQGLVMANGRLYESVGRYGESALRELDRETGAVLRSEPLADALYGEGLAAVGDRLLQLTWQEESLLVWSRATLTEVDRIDYEGEGWGLCLSGDRLVMSDGSDTLSMRDSTTFAETGRLDVMLDGAPQSGLNELECIDGIAFANVWTTNEIVMIDLESGAVTAVIDASALSAEVSDSPGVDVLNGIAYDEDAATFLLTGKLWPTIFEVRFVQAP